MRPPATEIVPPVAAYTLVEPRVSSAKSVFMNDAEEDGRSAAHQARLVEVGRGERAVRLLEQQPLLRVGEVGLPRRHREEAVVEELGLLCHANGGEE